MPQLQDEIIPDGSILRVDNIPWSMVEALRQQVYCPQEPLDKVVRGKFPVIIVQSTRAKVKDIIAAIEARGAYSV